MYETKPQFSGKEHEIMLPNAESVPNTWRSWMIYGDAVSEIDDTACEPLATSRGPLKTRKILFARTTAADNFRVSNQ